LVTEELVRCLSAVAATPEAWRLTVLAARAAAPAVGVTAPPLPDNLFLAKAGLITLADPACGISVVVPEANVGILAKGPGAGAVLYATTVASLWHELAHVDVLRRLPLDREFSKDDVLYLEMVALSAQSRVMAHVLGEGSWQTHLKMILMAARLVNEAEPDPLLAVYERAGELLLGELEGLSYAELVGRAVEWMS
jgi:hypothetical protein